MASSVVAWAIDAYTSESYTFRIHSVELLTQTERDASPDGSLWTYRFNYEAIGHEDVHCGIIVTSFGFNPFLRRSVTSSDLASLEGAEVTRKYRRVALPYLPKTTPAGVLAELFDFEKNGFVFFGPGRWNETGAPEN